MNKVVIVREHVKDSEPEVSIHANADSAVEYAKVKITQMCSDKSKTRLYEVKGFLYFGLNLVEGVLVTVEEKKVIYTTTGITTRMDKPNYKLDFNTVEPVPGWPSQ